MGYTTPCSAYKQTFGVIQANEVTQHEPECKIYFAMTKCDLLDQPPGVGTDGSTLEPSPQESGEW